MAKLTLEEINNIDIVDYLASIGYEPQIVQGNNYKYLSMLPDRFEKTPSFVVNRKKNRWKDFGNGAGTTMVSFCIHYHKWTIKEMIENLSRSAPALQNVTRPIPLFDEIPEAKIEIREVLPLQTVYLLRYLWERRVSIDVAQKYCVELHYFVHNRAYYAIGFRSDAGGYEIRNKFFKGSSFPKSITLIDNGSDEVVLFEGFFDFLTYLTLRENQGDKMTNYLVLNSTSLFKKAVKTLKLHRKIYSFLNNDQAGESCTIIGKKEIPGFEDQRHLFKSYNDLNEWVCLFGKAKLPSFNSNSPLDRSGP